MASRIIGTMERKIDIAVGENYHVYNRGVEKRQIFMTTHDHERFLRLLYIANGDKSFKYDRLRDRPLAEIDRGAPLVAIGAYALMPNHFHLLVCEIREGGTSRFMERLTTAYAMYFNKVYDRVGGLFQGTYKAQYIDSDEYLRYLFAYIHLNPVKLFEPKWRECGLADVAGARFFLSTYRYSSYMEHVGHDREEKLILTQEAFPNYFTEPSSFDRYVEDWLSFAPGDRSV